MHRQETPHCRSVSFERHAANAFQSYVSGALAFSIKRGGILYGNVDEEGKAVVEVIYEPEQVKPFESFLCCAVNCRLLLYAGYLLLDRPGMG
jgi:nuclear protein localization family protein 4